jgi:hypothetical protein
MKYVKCMILLSIPVVGRMCSIVIAEVIVIQNTVANDDDDDDDDVVVDRHCIRMPPTTVDRSNFYQCKSTLQNGTGLYSNVPSQKDPRANWPLHFILNLFILGVD